MLILFTISLKVDNMGKIVAIGGGEIGRPRYPVETTEINKEIINLSGKTNPNLLHIPTAQNDSNEDYKTVKNHFEGLGCNINVLNLIRKKLTNECIKEKIRSSDIIYVSGGNTLKMMTLWRKYGVDKLLMEAYNNGTVLSGVSAGSICWFRQGNSDSRKFTSGSDQLIKVTGMGLIKALHCPHYDVELSRQTYLKQMMKKTPGVAIAIDDCCAIKFVDGKYQVVASKPGANAYKIYWNRGTYHEKIIPKSNYFNSIEELLKK